jgi:predicted ATPase
MPGYILTGTPGAGKTAILRQLELDGHPVVEEAATDVIALQQAVGGPWHGAAFVDRIVALQRQRQRAAREGAFFDRSPVCTLALSRLFGLDPSAVLLAEIERLRAEQHYHRAVFFVRNQGFVEPTAARRITFEESLRFEEIHEAAYRDLGFELVEVAPGPLPARVAAVYRAISTGQSARRSRREPTDPSSRPS